MTTSTTRGTNRRRMPRLLGVLALVAFLLGLGSPLVSATPIVQDVTKDELKEFCEVAGGHWVDMKSGAYACVFPDWDIACDGATCDIDCHQVKCVDPEGRIGRPEQRVQTTGAEDQVLAPVSTPTPAPTTPRGKSRLAAPDTIIVNR